MSLGRLICIVFIIQIKYTKSTADLCLKCSQMLNSDQCQSSRFSAHGCQWSFNSCSKQRAGYRILSSSSGVVSATACAQYLTQSQCTYIVYHNRDKAKACKWVALSGGASTSGASGSYGCVDGVAADIPMANCVKASDYYNYAFYTYSTFDSVCTECINNGLLSLLQANNLKIALGLLLLLFLC